ncbi:uncharacterized protein Cp110 isoform X2 [Plodia interpunctella]|uniref:uncharacterized protein Cp110 isoform X2 n=1 Tax=Plodia interpunctella TaxID=58824 RepID=UPI002367DF59|nr:uncharacterized protein LOC128674576 isoform X2 [Plodia interpunctella]
MNDPWDVKSVRKSGQYLSCMKINGVPLLPPVLSKECRKEMQYYKLLAKEVEKRIALLKPYTLDSDPEDSDNMTDAPDISESDHTPVEPTVTKSPPSSPEKSVVESPKPCLTLAKPNVIEYHNITQCCEEPPNSTLIMDLTLDIIGANRNSLESPNMQLSSQTEIPERDCESPKKNKEIKQIDDAVQQSISSPKNQAIMDSVKCFVDNILSETYAPLKQDGPSSLSSKSFTGSLNDLHTGSLADSQKSSKLIRQRSYTLLEPSPQLLAHLEVQSLNTGVEMTNISMSESLSNLSSPNKKRRSWDLESAKVKWSSMALELNAKNVPKPNGVNKNATSKTTTSLVVAKKTPPSAPRSKSVAQEKPRRPAVVNKSMVKSESAQKVAKRSLSPVRNSTSVVIHRPNAKETSPKNTLQKKDVTPMKPLISESEDPATKVKELYEKMQKQQQAQMASLVEKQKREQLLLQQLFEEQNNLLFKQLKAICPKSPLEAKEAWVDKVSDTEKGLVSLSQLINQNSPDHTIVNSPVSSTLTDTHFYINHCNDILKKSRDTMGSSKKHIVSKNQNGAKTQSPRNLEGSSTRTHSPRRIASIASRRLNYDSSNSTDRECEPLLTDRTNDTFADLNVTLPSDTSDDAISYQGSRQSCSKSPNDEAIPANGIRGLSNSNIDTAIRNMEESLYKSINANKRQMRQVTNVHPSAEEREAATKIVAFAKGYLVRRLMRTDRVQATVQTIKDALLCALQLHQDRAGIRGADVDLHRRLIQQITAACYSLHDTFVTSSPSERCALLAADRVRKRAQAQLARPRSHRPSDIMTQSHSGSFPVRVKRPPSSPMSRSNYETFSSENLNTTRYMQSPQRRPWR